MSSIGSPTTLFQSRSFLVSTFPLANHASSTSLFFIFFHLDLPPALNQLDVEVLDHRTSTIRDLIKSFAYFTQDLLLVYIAFCPTPCRSGPDVKVPDFRTLQLSILRHKTP